MLSNKPSIYKDNVDAKRGKLFLGSLSNLALVFIVSVLLFAVVFKLAGDNLPITKQILSEIQLKENKYHDERKNAGLLIYDSSNNLWSEDYVILNTVRNETKTALVHYNLEESYQTYETYKKAKLIDKSNLLNNPSLYYFCEYKLNNPEYYSEDNDDNYFYNYYSSKIQKDENFELYDLSNKNNEIHYFNKNLALSLADYFFKEDKYDKAVQNYETVTSIFENTHKFALDDFNKNNLKAKALLEDYQKSHDKYANSLIIEMFLSYILASFLVYLLPYFINSNYDSVGSLVLKTPIVSLNGNKIGFGKELGIYLLNLIANLHSLFFLILVLFGRIELAFHSFGGLSIAFFSLIGLVFSLASLLIMLFYKKHQFLDVVYTFSARKDREVVQKMEENENE